MTEQEMSELDMLAREAYLADCQEQGILVETEWNKLDTSTQDRYRAIAHSFTDGWMSAAQLERSLILEMASVGVEIKRHEGDATTAMHYTWRVPALGLEDKAEMFEFALRAWLLPSFGNSRENTSIPNSDPPVTCSGSYATSFSAHLKWDSQA